MITGSLPFDGQDIKELLEWLLVRIYNTSFYVSMDYENLLKKFLVLTPTKRALLEEIMKDPCMKMGHGRNECLP